MASLFVMTHGEDRHQLAVLVVKYKITATSKLDKPFPELRRHAVDVPAHFRIGDQRLHSLADDAHRTAGSGTVFRCEKGMHACEVAQCRRRPDDARHGSVVR